MDMNAKSRSMRSDKTVRRISIESARNGGHIVEHHFNNSDGPYREPEQHVFSKGDHEKMLAHVANTLKLPEPKGGKVKADADSAAGAAS
jgi:hypothetical protein